MRILFHIAVLSALLLAGCCGPTIRPSDTYWRPGVATSAYKNVLVSGPRYDPDGVTSAVENAFARVGLTVLTESQYKSAEEVERLATLLCGVEVRSEYPAAVTIELRDVAQGRVFSTRATTGVSYGGIRDLANMAVAEFTRQYAGYDRTATMAPYSRGEVINMSRQQFTDYVDKRGADLDLLEGIWADDKYTYEVGIYRDTTVADRDFVAFVISTSAATWRPGQVKAEFRKTSDPGVYRTTYYLRDHSKQTTVAKLGDGWMTISYSSPYSDSQEQMVLTRSYPASEGRARPSPEPRAGGIGTPSIGTGFLVSEDGLVATNFHVVDGIEAVEVYFPSMDVSFDGTVVLKDRPSDIVLLKLEGFALSKLTSKGVPYGIAGAGDIGLGGEAFTLGFPLSVVLGQSIKLSDGTVSALSGIDDDPRLFQISCPVQPGNSGGPLFNKDGNVVGVVVSSLNASYFHERASIMPQNVNFAVKADYLRSLLAMSPGGKDALARAGRLRGKSVEDQVKLISPFIAAIRSR